MVDEIEKGFQCLGCFVGLAGNHSDHDILRALPVSGDVVRLVQVITNLVSNAIKYSPRADKIIVKTSVELGLDTLMIGATKRGALERMLRGEVLKRITEQLPKEKRLIICN